MVFFSTLLIFFLIKEYCQCFQVRPLRSSDNENPVKIFSPCAESNEGLQPKRCNYSPTPICLFHIKMMFLLWCPGQQGFLHVQDVIGHLALEGF